MVWQLLGLLLGGSCLIVFRKGLAAHSLRQARKGPLGRLQSRTVGFPTEEASRRTFAIGGLAMVMISLAGLAAVFGLPRPAVLIIGGATVLVFIACVISGSIGWEKE